MDFDNFRKELNCKIYPYNTLGNYKFTVICSNYNDKWIFSKHKQRDTWETQGGHIEPKETPLENAKRELFEKSGITDANLYPVCDYDGYTSEGSSNGIVYLAVVNKLGQLPESEMERIELFDEIPENFTYPNVTPKLIKEAKILLKKLNTINDNK